MQIIQKMRKQRGSITLLGVGSIVLSLIAFSQVTEYANAKILDRQLDNYARDVASVALRSELALTLNMADRDSYTSTTVDSLLASVGMSIYDSTDETQVGNLEKKITFGKIINGKFEPITEGDPSNPKASDDFIEFSAVAVQLWSKEKSVYNFTPQGKAIYGLPEAAANSTDIADCFCDKRYQACLTTEPNMALYPVVPAPNPAVTLSNIMGAANSDERKNYCDYGYVQSQVVGDNTKSKFPSVELSSQWLGKTADGALTLIDPAETTAVSSSYKVIANQQPLFVQPGVNPFQTQTWSFWSFSWFGSQSSYLARNWDGTVYDDGDITNALEEPYFFKSQWGADPVKVDGYFYVGRKGTCVAGTTVSDVPNISGGLEDLTQVATNLADTEVQRCLSYYTDNFHSVTTTTTENQCTTTCSTGFGCCGFCMGGVTTTCEDVEVDNTETYPGYAQQSCRDFNSNVKTRMNFFQWMMSLFFGPFTNIETSYQQLDCSVKKMQYFNISLPFLGTFSWQIL